MSALPVATMFTPLEVVHLTVAPPWPMASTWASAAEASLMSAKEPHRARHSPSIHAGKPPMASAAVRASSKDA